MHVHAPTHPDQLSPTVLTDLLRHPPRAGLAAPVPIGSTVSTLSAAPLGAGQIADTFRLSIDLSTGERVAIVAKTAASDPAARAAGRQLGLYRREVGFYRELAAHLDVSSPACYHVEMDEDEQFLLLLQDLAPATPLSQIDGCGREVAEAVMVQAARMHAPRWADPRLEKLSWLHVGEQWNTMQASMYPDLFRGFRERYAEMTDASHFAPGETLVANLDAWYAGQRRPWTVQHGDYRLDNLLVEDDGTGRVSVHVVDWQTVMLGPGLVDVAYFLGTSLSVDDRRRHETTLVRRYHDELLAGGVTDYDWNTCWEDYRRFAFAGYLMATSASMVAERTDRGDRLFVAMLERSATQVGDLEAARALTRN